MLWCPSVIPIPALGPTATLFIAPTTVMLCNAAVPIAILFAPVASKLFGPVSYPMDMHPPPKELEENPRVTQLPARAAAENPMATLFVADAVTTELCPMAIPFVVETVAPTPIAMDSDAVTFAEGPMAIPLFADEVEVIPMQFRWLRMSLRKVQWQLR